MQNTGYYRILDHSQNDFCDLSDSIIINCTGRIYTGDLFDTRDSNLFRSDFFLMYVTEGKVRVEFDEKEIILCPGTGIIYYPNQKMLYAAEKCGIVSYYWVHFTGSRAEEILSRFQFKNHFIFNIGLHTPIVQLFDKMASEIICREEDFAFCAATYLLQILVDIRRYIASPKGMIQAGRLKKSIEYLHRHYDKDISIDKLAEIENFSESRYRFVFHELTGMSPKKYLTDVRMRHACELLNQTELTVSQIGNLVGYNDLLYFYRIFKKNIGITPSQYRSQYRNVLL